MKDILQERLDKCFRTWCNDELDIKELLGYEDDKEFSVVNVKYGIIEYYTSSGKMTFKFNKEVDQDQIPYEKWFIDWKMLMAAARELEDE